MKTEMTQCGVFLSGKRLYLRPPQEDDLERCYRWINDPEIRQYLMMQFPVTVDDERRWLQRQSDKGIPPTHLVFAIVLHDGDRHIGNMGLDAIDWVNRHGTTGALIGEKDCWNKGYGGEAKELLLEYAFNTLGLHRVNSGALSSNLRSIAYQKKSGYVEEGRERQAIFRDGRWVDHVRMGLLASEWRARQKT